MKTAEQLYQAWSSVYQGAGDAIKWIDEVKGNSKRVATEADGLVREMHRARNAAKSLARVSLTPMSIGFFGLSQAGKSYLISALAADKAGNLETEFGAARLNFIDHVNPVGGGKEATGLITRFRACSNAAPDVSYPIELKLFREIEIAKIIANSWFEDFDHERINSELTAERVNAVLTEVSDKLSTEQVSGVDADDVVSLWDYLENNYRRSVSLLEGIFWRKAMQMAPYLTVSHRAKLFSVLWGELSEFTVLYEQLANNLKRLSGASVVYAPLEAIVRADGDKYVQANSIMNVDALNAIRLNVSGYQCEAGSQSTLLKIRPFIDGELGEAVSIDSAELAALTTEFVFKLINEPANPIVSQVDLIDFPGYRSRQKLLNIKSGSDNKSPVPSLLLRGKVAYLFERYTNEQEMNALVLCTSTFKQSEVVSVGKVLSDWVYKTQGEKAEERKSQPTGLIWTLTMADGFVSQALSTRNEAMFPEACSNMMKLTMKERFGNLDWMVDWDGSAFNNTCLVRKPRLETTFISMKDGDEVGINENSGKLLGDLGAEFRVNELVRKHVADANEAWDAMLSLNDGGISRFGSKVAAVASLDYKLSRIEKQYIDKCSHIISSLDKFFQKDGEQELAARKESANKILNSFVKSDYSRRQIGEFISHLSLSDDALRSLYLNTDLLEESLATSSEKSEADADFDFFSEVDDVVVESKSYVELKTQEHLFATASYKLWVSHLRALEDRDGLLRQLGLSKDVVKRLTDEVVTCASRLGLEDKITASLLRRSQSGSHKDKLVQRNVLTVQLVINDFCAWFGYLLQDISERPRVLKLSPDAAVSPSVLFVNDYKFDDTGLPLLQEKVADNARIYSDFWISSLAHQTLANAGHKGGSDITPEQNSQLGRVISIVSGNV